MAYSECLPTRLNPWLRGPFLPGMSFATVRAQPKVGVLLGLSTGLLSTVALALDVKVILTPPCIFH